MTSHSLLCCYFSAHPNKLLRTLYLPALCVYICMCVCPCVFGFRDRSFQEVRNLFNPSYLEEPRLLGKLEVRELGHLNMRRRRLWSQVPRFWKMGLRFGGRAILWSNTSQVCLGWSRSSVHSPMPQSCRTEARESDPWELVPHMHSQLLMGTAAFATSGSMLHFIVIRIHISTTLEGS